MASFTNPAWWTLAYKVALAIDAGAAVLAGRVGAFVYIDAAVRSSPTLFAGASEGAFFRCRADAVAPARLRDARVRLVFAALA